MNLLVTGGCGFIGANVIHHLIDRAEILLLVNLDCLTYARDRRISARFRRIPRIASRKSTFGTRRRRQMSWRGTASRTSCISRRRATLIVPSPRRTTSRTQMYWARFYNIGSRCERTNRQIAERIRDLIDELAPHLGGDSRALIAHVADRPGHDRRSAIDPSKLEREFGLRAQSEFDETLRETVRWYLAGA